MICGIFLKIKRLLSFKKITNKPPKNTKKLLRNGKKNKKINQFFKIKMNKKILNVSFVITVSSLKDIMPLINSVKKLKLKLTRTLTIIQNVQCVKLG